MGLLFVFVLCWHSRHRDFNVVVLARPVASVAVSLPSCRVHKPYPTTRGGPSVPCHQHTYVPNLSNSADRAQQPPRTVPICRPRTYRKALLSQNRRYRRAQSVPSAQ